MGMFALKNETTGEFFDNDSGFYHSSPIAVDIYSKDFVLRDIGKMTIQYAARLLNHGGPMLPKTNTGTNSCLTHFEYIKNDTFYFYEFDGNYNPISKEKCDLRSYIHSLLANYDWLQDLSVFPSYRNTFLLRHLMEGNVRGIYFLPEYQSQAICNHDYLLVEKTSDNTSYWTGDSGSDQLMLARLSANIDLKEIDSEKVVEMWRLIHSI